MDIALYLFMVKIGMITLLIALFYKEDRDVQLIFNIVAVIFFFAIALMGFNIETTTYSGAWVTKSTVEYSYVLFGLMFVFISAIHGFVLIMERTSQTLQDGVSGLNFKSSGKL